MQKKIVSLSDLVALPGRFAPSWGDQMTVLVDAVNAILDNRDWIVLLPQDQTAKKEISDFLTLMTHS